MNAAESFCPTLKKGVADLLKLMQQAPLVALCYDDHYQSVFVLISSELQGVLRLHQRVEIVDWDAEKEAVRLRQHLY